MDDDTVSIGLISYGTASLTGAGIGHLGSSSPGSTAVAGLEPPQGSGAAASDDELRAMSCNGDMRVGGYSAPGRPARIARARTRAGNSLAFERGAIKFDAVQRAVRGDSNAVEVGGRAVAAHLLPTEQAPLNRGRLSRMAVCLYFNLDYRLTAWFLLLGF